MATDQDRFDTDLAAGLAAVRQDLASLTTLVGGFARQQTDAAGQRVTDGASDTRDTVIKGALDAKETIGSAAAEIGAGIERHPMTAMLVMFGVGMSLGLLGRRRA